MEIWNVLPDTFLHYLLILICLVACIYVVFTGGSRPRKLPPGPWGLPFVGYYPFVVRKPLETLEKLKQKYGGVFGFYLGRYYCVVLSDVDVMREAYAKEEVQARPQHSPFSLSTTKAMVELDGNNWNHLKKFSLQSLRSMGFGKSAMELIVQCEADSLIEEIYKPGRTCDQYLSLLKQAAMNTQCMFMYNQRFESIEDQNFETARTYLDIFNEMAFQLSLHTFFPWTKKCFAYLSWSKYAKLNNYSNWMRAFNRKHIEEHTEQSLSGRTKDYIDFFLEKMSKEYGMELYNDERLNASLSGFVRAGSGTILTWLQWSLLSIARYPEVQTRVQEEMKDVLGDRAPVWEDRAKLPYTQAVLNEALRWRSNVPINLLRRVTKDTRIGGMDVPNGTLIVTNLWSIHHDPERWVDPMTFDPDRWLTKDGKEVVKHDSYLPFSFGRRDCPGQVFGTLAVFLFFTGILHHFRVRFPKDETNDMDFIVTTLTLPKTFRLKFQSRNN